MVQTTHLNLFAALFCVATPRNLHIAMRCAFVVVLALWALALGAQSSRVDVRFHVTAACEISRVQALRTDKLSEVLVETSLRRAGRSLQPPAPVGASGDVLTGNEADAAIAKYRLENPDKYYLRTIRVQLADGTSAKLTCFFDKAERQTSTVLERSDGSEELNIDIGELPVQQTTVVVPAPPDDLGDL